MCVLVCAHALVFACMNVFMCMCACVHACAYIGNTGTLLYCAPEVLRVSNEDRDKREREAKERQEIKTKELKTEEEDRRGKGEGKNVDEGEQDGAGVKRAKAALWSDTKADMWSFGVVLYLLAYGRHPYSGTCVYVRGRESMRE
jgi:serine/threonine protein kinase